MVILHEFGNNQNSAPAVHETLQQNSQSAQKIATVNVRQFGNTNVDIVDSIDKANQIQGQTIYPAPTL